MRYFVRSLPFALITALLVRMAMSETRQLWLASLIVLVGLTGVAWSLLLRARVKSLGAHLTYSSGALVPSVVLIAGVILRDNLVLGTALPVSQVVLWLPLILSPEVAGKPLSTKSDKPGS